MMRGLTIDKKRGNILKIDRHKYVKLAYHGLSATVKGRTACNVLKFLGATRV